MGGLTVEQVETQLQQINAEEEALDRRVREGTLASGEYVRRVAVLVERLAQLHARIVDHVVSRTTIPDFPPTA
ncbi:hypothetical protein [Streptomyces sp. NBC_01304]|uniref:hypothetical protein n=1 Tax=Streptomyces sp. NBC_01304 TaxID=2903818 RepID=UPI002E105F91|nr:hypothetical protein OG430_49300 [Streptomyces sp. NBC_01304]